MRETYEATIITWFGVSDCVKEVGHVQFSSNLCFLSKGMALKLPFDRIKRIKDEHKWLVSGYIRKNKRSIPQSIISVILLFYYNTIDTSILNDEECEKLLDLFESENKFTHLGHYSYQLIYKKSRDGSNGTDFRDKVHDKRNVLCLISIKNGNVFGGFTATGWPKSGSGSIHDKKAFIFSIRSSKMYPPKIFNPKYSISKLEPKTIRYEPSYYCMFGDGCSIWMHGTTQDMMGNGCCYMPTEFEEPPHKDYLPGKNYYETWYPQEVEVFQLIQ